MGNRTGRHLILSSMMLLAACGGRALTELDGSAGAISSGGAQSTSAGAAQSSAGAAQASAGAAQSAGGNDPGTCNYDEDCTLIAAGCCGLFEPVTAAQLVAVSSALSDAYQRAQCPYPLPCPSPAPTPTEYAETLKYFRALCFHPQNEAGRCQILDVRGTPYTRCQTNSECILREGVDCCPACDGKGFVPVNSTINFCSVDTACDQCSSMPPAGLNPICQAGTCAFEPPKR